jgi:dTDP-4-amino-4,6-dideoxygalactose transaminase
VVNAGLKVSLYDVDPVTLSPVPESLSRAVDSRTLAVVVCHLFGYLADLDRVRQITALHGVPVIDDAAQAMGADFRGKPAGTCGDAGLYSLSRGKNINAVDGGIIVTCREDLAEALERNTFTDEAEGTPKLFLKALLLSALLRPSLYWLPRSLPFLNIGASVYNPDFTRSPFTPFQAGIAGRMLLRLPEITRTRRTSARMLRECLSGCKGFFLPRPVMGTEPVYLRFPLLIDGSGPVREAPELGMVRSYPEPLNRIRELHTHLVNGADPFPGAHRLADRLVTLPTHQFVTGRDRERMVAALGS